MAGGTIRIGIAGWNFPDWRGEFYPKGLPQKQELHFAARALRTIEINSTFYGLPKPESVAAWAAEVPADFRFPVKGPQTVTHIKKLNDVELPLANFFASGILALGEKLGPFVWQLPPNLGFNRDRMETFLNLLPHDAAALKRLAAKHDDRIKAPVLEHAGAVTIRHAIEVRHKSFADPAFLDLLRAHDVALVTADTAEWPTMDLTAGFAYLRLQGAPGSDHYSEADLDLWAARLKALAEGADLPEGRFIGGAASDGKPRDVFAYFVSTDKVHAPRNAMAIMQRLG
ncbi:MAG TPA: DUF72 domain-containing protein, partial [Devosia sp.]|nr:DUF72 domain-containing protein [Devosia sp.]